MPKAAVISTSYRVVLQRVQLPHFDFVGSFPLGSFALRIWLHYYNYHFIFCLLSYKHCYIMLSQLTSTENKCLKFTKKLR